MPSATPFVICPSDAPLGAAIHGVDLSQPLDEVTFRAIEDAYHTHTVLVFRQRRPEHLLHFARRLGPVEMSPRTQFALPGSGPGHMRLCWLTPSGTIAHRIFLPQNTTETISVVLNLERGLRQRCSHQRLDGASNKKSGYVTAGATSREG